MANTEVERCYTEVDPADVPSAAWGLEKIHPGPGTPWGSSSSCSCWECCAGTMSAMLRTGS